MSSQSSQPPVGPPELAAEIWPPAVRACVAFVSFARELVDSDYWPRSVTLGLLRLIPQVPFAASTPPASQKPGPIAPLNGGSMLTGE